MRKIIKKIGGSIGIIVNKEEAKTHNIKIGDIIDLSNIIVIKQKKRRLNT